ncbi:MAG: MarR family winged helix-turn-helix transcriptional regulator [Acidimicrobiales bacterium]
MGRTLSNEDYHRLLSLRTGLRRFLAWSARQAGEAELTPSQHQLLLAIRGHGDGRGPTIGELADYLLLRHHSVVGLVDRAAASGLVLRDSDPDDRRVVRVVLTPKGQGSLELLTATHLEELERLASQLQPLWHGLEPVPADHGGTRTTSSSRDDH